MICENCFNDKFLTDHIRTKGTVLAVCRHCQSANAHSINGEDLADFLYPVISLYNESTEEDSKTLVEYIRRDWSRLTKINDTVAGHILDEIFPTENLSGKRFRSKQSQSSRVNLWNDFQSELKHKNRFFPQTKIIETEDLKNLFSFLILKNPPDDFFRARICDGKYPFPIEQMGRPPVKLTKGGRANPLGISYLYTASDMQTAISEVRPSVGDCLCIVKLSKHAELTLLDLRSPRETISPFEMDADNLLKLLNDLEFLCQLGDQLSKAILPKEADLEYLASQYLCEMIKHFNYDGVVYKSSVGQGFNIAFFDDSKVTLSTDVTLYSVSGVLYEATPV